MHDVEVRQQQVDGRHKALPLQPVLVQVLRPLIGGHDERHAAAEQRFEQTREDHRVGDVGDEQFVEADDPAAGRQALRDELQRTRAAVDAGEFRMHAAHEMVEVAAHGGALRHLLASRIRLERCDEKVHEQRLAATDAPPQIHPAGRRRSRSAGAWRQGPAQPLEDAGRWIEQRVAQRVEVPRGRALRAVIGQSMCADLRLETRRDRQGVAQHDLDACTGALPAAIDSGSWDRSRPQA